jgi:hypothetical protein
LNGRVRPVRDQRSFCVPSFANIYSVRRIYRPLTGLLKFVTCCVSEIGTTSAHVPLPRGIINECSLCHRKRKRATPRIAAVCQKKHPRQQCRQIDRCTGDSRSRSILDPVVYALKNRTGGFRVRCKPSICIALVVFFVVIGRTGEIGPLDEQPRFYYCSCLVVSSFVRSFDRHDDGAALCFCRLLIMRHRVHGVSKPTPWFRPAGKMTTHATGADRRGLSFTDDGPRLRDKCQNHKIFDSIDFRNHHWQAQGRRRTAAAGQKNKSIQTTDETTKKQSRHHGRSQRREGSQSRCRHHP